MRSERVEEASIGMRFRCLSFEIRGGDATVLGGGICSRRIAEDCGIL